jgi:tetratricopeptide (TPR) repeat protein
MWPDLQYTFIFKRLAAAALAALSLTGCASSVEGWIVSTRVHQGQVALERGNVRDAELSYQLALRVNPADSRARSGYIQAAGDLAQAEYAQGQFEDALATINNALKYDPSSVRLSALKAQIEQARLKRDIVISNYPTYREAGTQIQREYEQLSVANKAILASLKRFSYTYDTADLTSAIKRSYGLELDVAKNTNRLITYRQVVDSGIPESTHESTSSNAASLLPLP